MRVMKWKIVLASLFAVFGLVLMARTFWPASTPKPAVVEVPEKPKSAKAEALLAGSFDTHPTPETVEQDIGRATDRVRAQVQAARSPSLLGARRTDLPAAFEERLAALINPDHARDARARAARGKQGETLEPDEDMIAAAQGRMEMYGHMALDIQNLEMREIFRDGVRVAPMYFDEGFTLGESYLTGDTAFPLSEADPEDDRLDIVEVRMPMHFPAAIGRGEFERQRRLIGFQFVWSEERNQWIPWKNVQYSAGDGGSMFIPF